MDDREHDVDGGISTVGVTYLANTTLSSEGRAAALPQQAGRPPIAENEGYDVPGVHQPARTETRSCPSVGLLPNIGLRRALRLLIDAPKLADIEGLYLKADNPPSRWQAILEQELADLDAGLAPQDALTLLATFRLILPKRFFDLQAVAETDGPHIVGLLEAVEKAIERWPDELLMAQFREARAEFSTESSPFAFPMTLAPAALFGAKTIEETRKALAAYVVRDRPRLVQDWLRSKGEQWPDRAISLASILADSDTESPLAREPNAAEKRALASLLRLLSLSAQLFKTDERLLRDTIGLKRSLLSIRTIADWMGRWEKNKGAPLLALFLVELKTLVRDLGLLTQSTPVELVLRSYKLRNEVACRPPHPELKQTMHELFFQRHVCAYLLDFGIPSFGTKFGRMETDLILKMHPTDEEFVVEAKVIRAQTTPAKARRTDPGRVRPAAQIYGRHAHDASRYPAPLLVRSFRDHGAARMDPPLVPCRRRGSFESLNERADFTDF